MLTSLVGMSLLFSLHSLTYCRFLAIEVCSYGNINEERESFLLFLLSSQYGKGEEVWRRLRKPLNSFSFYCVILNYDSNIKSSYPDFCCYNFGGCVYNCCCLYHLWAVLC
jgi:hypothetical protein